MKLTPATAITFIAVAGLAFGIAQAVLNFRVHQHIATSLFFLPFACFGTCVTFTQAKYKPVFALLAALFTWVSAILV